MGIGLSQWRGWGVVYPILDQNYYCFVRLTYSDSLSVSVTDSMKAAGAHSESVRKD